MPKRNFACRNAINQLLLLCFGDIVRKFNVFSLQNTPLTILEFDHTMIISRHFAIIIISVIEKKNFGRQNHYV